MTDINGEQITTLFQSEEFKTEASLFTDFVKDMIFDRRLRILNLASEQMKLAANGQRGQLADTTEAWDDNDATDKELKKWAWYQNDLPRCKEYSIPF